MESERCLRGLVADSGRASHRSESTGWFIASCEMSREQSVTGKKENIHTRAAIPFLKARPAAYLTSRLWLSLASSVARVWR